MKSYTEFKDFYFKYNKLPFNLYYNPKKILKESELQNKYKAYLKSKENRKSKEAEKKEQMYQKLNEKKLKYYNNRIEKNKKLLETNQAVDEKWEELKKLAYIRDNNCCQFYKTLSVSEKKIIDTILKSNKNLMLLDVAHIKSKSEFPELKYDLSNVICLYRYFHYCFDNYIDPYKGVYVGKNISDALFYERLKI